MINRGLTRHAAVPVKGSVGAVAAANNTNMGDVFLEVNTVCIVDISGSMSSDGSEPGTSRWEFARQALSRLQNERPGKVALVAFSETPQFCPDGQLPIVRGSTCVGEALKFAKLADVPGMSLLLISDGQPTDGNAGLVIARTFDQKIDTIYVGPRHDVGAQNFLKRLSAATGGKHVDDFACVKLLTSMDSLLPPPK